MWCFSRDSYISSSSVYGFSCLGRICKFLLLFSSSPVSESSGTWEIEPHGHKTSLVPIHAFKPGNSRRQQFEQKRLCGWWNNGRNGSKEQTFVPNEQFRWGTDVWNGSKQQFWSEKSFWHWGSQRLQLQNTNATDCSIWDYYSDN